MKIKMLAMIVCSVVAGSAMGQNSDALNNARQKVSESEKHYSEGEQQYHDAAYELGSGVNGSSTQMHMNVLGAERAQAYGEEYNAERAADYQQRQAALSKQPALTLTASKPAVQAVKVDSKPHNSSINVSANSLNPDTKVTFNGKPTTAGALKADTQVSVGINSAFIHTPKGGNNNVRSNSRNEHGTGNGADNAHASAFGGHSAGGGFHF